MELQPVRCLIKVMTCPPIKHEWVTSVYEFNFRMYTGVNPLSKYLLYFLYKTLCMPRASLQLSITFILKEPLHH
jgi:hypothetical protein